GGEPRCVCSAFEQAAGVVCERSAPASQGGGSIADAVPLSPSAEPQQGALLFPNQQTYSDQNVYVFSATAGEVYRFTVTFAVENRYAVKVMDASGAVLVEDSCGHGGPGAYHAGLVAPTSGPLYLSVGHALGCGHAVRESGYSLLFEALGPEDHGDEPDAATPLAPGETAQTGRIELAGDRDWFAFDAEAGRVYRFTCVSHMRGSCYVRLLDAGGSEVEGRNAYQAPTVVSVEAAVAGRYRLVVSNGTPSIEHDWGTYDYRLEDLGPDDHGDTRAQATSLPAPGQWVTARVETRRDVDVFVFETVPEHIYRIVPEAPLPAFRLEVHDAAGVARVAQYGALGFEASGGVHSLSVAGPQEEPLGSLRFQLVDLGLDDHGDTEATASPLAVGETVGRLELGTDVDVFSFPAEDEHAYQVSCSGCALELRGATSTLHTLRYSEFTLMEASAGDTAFVKVRPSWLSETGAYTVRIVDLGRDDYGDSAATAHPIAVGEQVPGSLEVHYDQDVFAVSLVAGQVYSFASGSSAPGADLRSPDGGPVEVQWSELGERYLPAQSGVHTLTLSCGPQPSIHCGGPYRFTLQ
ncbi:MAG TPA: hypothetical protein VFO83_13875, partial [Aggregicoccus sp.]|nr:hypothetical protein [Aggregicoccus sp.]